MRNSVIIQNITIDELKEIIDSTVQKYLSEHIKIYDPFIVKEYLTRRDVADMFSCDISTVHNWCKEGRLNPLGLGRRVYFLRSEIEASLVRLNG